MTAPFIPQALNLFDYTRDLRRDLHKNPELGFQEQRTAGIVARELRSLNLEVTTGIAKTGVVGLLEGDQPGPVVLARFDMDALPVTEETGVEYASQTPGKMHACGHDGHVAIGLTVARVLNEQKSNLHGTVKFVFQPAEEGLGGADLMLQEGVLENPAPVRTLAMHLWNERPVGWVGISPGPLMAASELFKVRLIGKGGHGAMPDQTIDPIAAAAQVVTAWQSIVARNVPPVEGGVISVTTIHAGEAFNVIPPAVEMMGTIRSFDPLVREIILLRFRQVAEGIGNAMGCEVDIHLQPVTPAVINDPGMAAKLQKMVREQFPELKLDTGFRSMVSEDMAVFMQKVPGVYMLVGANNPAKGLTYSHHHPKFNFDEEVLPSAVALMASAVLTFLE